MDSLDKKVSLFATTAWPKEVGVLGSEARSRYDWVIRFKKDSQIPVSTVELERKLQLSTVRGIEQAHKEIGIPMVNEALPTLQLTIVDEIHLIVHLELRRTDRDPSNSWLVGATSMLRALDKELLIDDIQGIPKRFWLVMRDVGPV